MSEIVNMTVQLVVFSVSTVFVRLAGYEVCPLRSHVLVFLDVELPLSKS